MEMGWEALAVERPRCSHPLCRNGGRILFTELALAGQLDWRLADIFKRAKCSVCRRRPSAGKLAASVKSDDATSWHEREVLFIDGFVVKPGRW
jgi:hypothetical protein